MKQVTILLAEDHTIVREGLRLLVEAHRDLKIVGEATTGREAVKMATELGPEVVVMDIAMPLLNGLEATRQILKVRPEIKVLILSAHSDSEYIERMVKVGASGFLVKQTSGNALVKAIREVHRGKGYFTPSVALYLKQHHLKRGKGLKKGGSAQMTSREAEMLQLIAEGQGNKGIAFELEISVKTVEKHRQTLMEKLNIHDIAGLTRFAIATGIIESSIQSTTGKPPARKKPVRPMKADALKRERERARVVRADLKKSKTRHGHLLTASRHLQEELRLLSRRLLVSQEEERKRISRELHDEIVQTLVAISMHLSGLTIEEPIDIRDLKKKIARTQRLVEKSVNIVHRFARELRPMVLDDLGLIPALQSFIKDFSRRTGIAIHFTAFAKVETLSNDQKMALYRVSQSALSNVHKHAKATKVTLSIRRLLKIVRLEIHDNGCSFRANLIPLARRRNQLGLLGSRERVEMIGGKFAIRSKPGRGTSVIAQIPF